MHPLRFALSLFLRCALAGILAAPNSAAATSQQLFRPAVIYPAGYASVSIAVGDLRGDGIPDIVVESQATTIGYAGPGSVEVLLGNGDGTFQSAVSYPTGGYDGAGYGTRTTLALGDFNGDGKLDIVVANPCATSACQNGGTVSLLFGNGDGTFQPARTFASGGQGQISLGVADFNGDGKLDLAVASDCLVGATLPCEDGMVSVLLGNGDGTFQAPSIYPTGGALSDFGTTADLRGDGKLDLVIVDPCGSSPSCPNSGSISVLLGNGDGTFQPAMMFADGGYLSNSVAAGDLNGDGKIDLAVANECATASCGPLGSVTVLRGNGDGTFQEPTTYSSGGVGAGGIVIKDFNGDGKLDAAIVTGCAGNCNYSAVKVLLGTGTGTLQLSATAYLLPVGSDQVAVADLNGDGKPDLAVILGNNVAVLLNSATAQSSTSVSSSLNPSTYGQSVTITASVSSPATAESWGTPAGSVTFMDGSNTLGTSELSGGVATLTTSSLGAGSDSITAVYAGSGNFAGSTSKPLAHSVAKATTNTTLTSSANPITVGQSVTFTATVSSSASTPPKGETVTFSNGATTLGTGTLSSGVATLTTSSLPAGNYAITATYSGDANLSTSRSSILKETVNQ
jgi:Bacterial Ig-like domain (group 3)/FG-GAP-like repeat